MKRISQNSIVAENNSTICKARIKVENGSISQEEENINGINNSVFATDCSQIEHVKVYIKQEKRKSFWSGFWGGIIVSVIGGGVWYLIQTTLL